MMDFLADLTLVEILLGVMVFIQWVTGVALTNQQACLEEHRKSSQKAAWTLESIEKEVKELNSRHFFQDFDKRGLK